jgi:hypothetical protein
LPKTSFIGGKINKKIFYFVSFIFPDPTTTTFGILTMRARRKEEELG